MFIFLTISFLASSVAFLHLRFNFWAKSKEGFTVLKYVQISDHSIDNETISISNFEKQLKYLHLKQFSTVRLEDLIKGSKLPEKPVMITIDKGKIQNLDQIASLLTKYRFSIVLFIPIAYIGEKLDWKNKPTVFLELDQLKALDLRLFEIAFNSYFHISYSSLQPLEVSEDISACLAYEENNRLGLQPAIAYPDKMRFENKEEKDKLIKILGGKGIKLGFVKGNQINPIPLTEKFLINRIEIDGRDGMLDFKIKLKKGKSKRW